MVPLNWKMKMPPGQLGLLMPVNQHAQKERVILIIKGKMDDAIQQKTKGAYLEWRKHYRAPLNAFMSCDESMETATIE